MLIECRKCWNRTEAKLDVDTNEVICEDCGEPTEVNNFIKKSLKDIGQIIRTADKKPFSLLCSNCNRKRTVYMKDDKVFCDFCDTRIIVSNHFKTALKEYLDNKNE